MGRYTQEFKAEAIALAIKSHRSHQEIALDLGINPSTFRNWMSEELMTEKPKRKNTKKTQAELEKELHAMKKELAFRQEEIDILKKAAAYFAKNQKERIRRRMIIKGLKAKQYKAFKVTTDSDHDFLISSNILNREFDATKPNQKWVGDITYIHTAQGWLYLATVIDLYSRKVVGWSMSCNMKASLVCNALNMALVNRGYPEGVLFHSDRGSQYCSYALS